MKRSEINRAISDAIELFEKHNFPLPHFANWTIEKWKNKGDEINEIKDNMLGWDITDFGSGKFDEIGLLLITLRNGNIKQPRKYPKPYAEKIMMVKEGQITPMHYHRIKMEDIINRGGGNLIIKLFNSDDNNGLAKTDVNVSIDGEKHVFAAGCEICLKPGQSITLTQGLYHEFWGEKEKGSVIVSEVSMCNDDNADNVFFDDVGRFPQIEEDALPIRLLCNEYDSYLRNKR